ncbi:alpha-factor pheromone receptor STE2 [Sugiyamaella lignohabitans]|uniref:Alpha-factor pheromone receptor STE2 n=1 Tax=Sugiyamaella lignohabitans TaxID=796027 RepID=A0A161HL65_9ASCO|nr:alpha-factor pheromone receptor STE2 [Sugiyamaella lignohabitans]ANB12728.1 alpha-factor pheromone receptor STE2 [Sugiyamaella lignohabitans]
MVGLSEDYLSQNRTLLNQTFMVDTIEGPTPVMLSDFDSYLSGEITYALIFGLRIGTAAIVSILLALISKKYKSPVFWLNQTSLILLIIHSGLFISYLLGPFGSVTTEFTGSYANVTYSALCTSVAASWLQLLLVVSIESSLLFQTRSVFPEYGKYRNIFTAIVFCIATLPTIVIWTYNCVLSTITTIYPDKGYLLTGHNLKIYYALWPIFSASVVFYSAIFGVKLFLAIRRRRRLGLKQFDTTQIIFIMSIQTMIIPAIFTIIQFALSDVPPGYTAFTPLLVVVFLPLSAMWASFNIATPNISSNSFVPFVARSDASSVTYASKKRGQSSKNDTEAAIHSASPISPSFMSHKVRTPNHNYFAADDDEEDMFTYNEIIRTVQAENTRGRQN